MEILLILAVLALCYFPLAVSRRKGHSGFHRSQAKGKREGRFLPPGGMIHPPPFDPATATATTSLPALKGHAHVIDGDTITISNTQVRLFGIDAPELDHPYGKNAKYALITLCKAQFVRAEVVATDDHGRTVAQCYLPDGRDLSAEMVRCGLALDWQKYSGGRYRLLETPDARRKLWLADARQKGRMEVWERFAAKRAAAATKD